MLKKHAQFFKSLFIISDLFIFSRYALIMKGDSVCPRKIFPATERLSAPDNLSALLNAHARP